MTTSAYNEISNLLWIYRGIIAVAAIFALIKNGVEMASAPVHSKAIYRRRFINILIAVAAAFFLPEVVKSIQHYFK